MARLGLVTRVCFKFYITRYKLQNVGHLTMTFGQMNSTCITHIVSLLVQLSLNVLARICVRSLRFGTRSTSLCAISLCVIFMFFVYV